MDDDRVVVRAEIADSAGVTVATGHAEEKRSASQINQTSALEKLRVFSSRKSFGLCWIRRFRDCECGRGSERYLPAGEQTRSPRGER
jgi:hypothetical protein